MHSLKARALDLMTRAEAAITDFASETARPVDAPLFAGSGAPRASTARHERFSKRTT